MIRVEGKTTDSVDDPIEWEVYGQRQTATGLDFRHVVLRRSDRMRLTEAFGAEWLEAHKAQKAAEIRTWEIVGDCSVN